MDGTGNNVANPTWGVVGTPQLRLMQPNYADGFGLPRNNTNPRVVSNLVVGYMPLDPTNKRPFSDFLTVWGQFMDHDIVLTDFNTSDPWPIPIPLGDPWFNPFDVPGMTMGFNRGFHTPNSGVPGVPRQIINSETHYLDGSTVYGPTLNRSLLLRTFTGGLMDTSLDPFGNEYLPYNWGNNSVANEAHLVPDYALFLAGDIRANENPLLTAVHTLFLREHNRMARLLAQQNPTWTDEILYQEARRWVIATIQAISFEEYVPFTLGVPMPEYQGYDPTVNPSVDLFFTGAAFRYGHSEVSSAMPRLNEDRSVIQHGNLLLRDGFFYPPSWVADGIEPLIRGMVSQVQQEVDMHYVDDIRNFLFGFPGRGGFDLVSRNLQRGRDYGLSYLNEARAYYGLGEWTSFEDIVPYDHTWATLLSQAYNGDISKIDPYVGGLAEQHEGAANVGPTFAASIMDQYMRTRDGDRFYYKNADAGFTAAQIAELDNTRLVDVVLRNTDIQAMPCTVFIASSILDCGQPSPSPRPSGNAVLLDGLLQVQWTMTASSITVTLVAQTLGWFAFGLSPQNRMIDSDVVVVTVGASGVDVVDAMLTTRDISGVLADVAAGGTNDLTNIHTSQVNNVTTVRYTRLLVTGDAMDVDIINGYNTVAFAVNNGLNGDYGDIDNGQLEYHGPTNRGTAQIDFFTNIVAPAPAPHTWLSTTGKIVHGWFMVGAWAILAPTGWLVGRYMPRGRSWWWFRIHNFCMGFAVLVMLTAFFIAVLFTENMGMAHFVTVHGRIGIAAVCAAIFTGVLGVWSAVTMDPERTQTPLFPDRLYSIFTGLVVGLGIANLFIGLVAYGVPVWYFIVLAVWIGLFLIAAGILQLCRRRLDSMLPFEKEMMSSYYGTIRATGSVNG